MVPGVVIVVLGMGASVLIRTDCTTSSEDMALSTSPIDNYGYHAAPVLKMPEAEVVPDAAPPVYAEFRPRVARPLPSRLGFRGVRYPCGFV